MAEPEGGLSIVYPLKKELFEDNEEGRSLALVVTMENNTPQLALLLPEQGGTLFLDGIETVEELKTFESAITSWSPVY